MVVFMEQAHHPPHALIIHGGWSGHQPAETAAFAAHLLREAGCTVTLADSLAAFGDADLLARQRLLVPVWTMGDLPTDSAKVVLAAVRAGLGVGGWHGGMCDAFRSNVEWQFLTGGNWVAHPGNLIDYTVNIVRQDHPITAGLSSFAMHSEQYYLHVDPAVEVLATTTFHPRHDDHAWIEGVVMPTVWTKGWGKGRVFYTALGHQLADLQVPTSTTILDRGLRWAAGLL